MQLKGFKHNFAFMTFKKYGYISDCLITKLYNPN